MDPMEPVIRHRTNLEPNPTDGRTEGQRRFSAATRNQSHVAKPLHHLAFEISLSRSGRYAVWGGEGGEPFTR